MRTFYIATIVLFMAIGALLIATNGTITSSDISIASIDGNEAPN